MDLIEKPTTNGGKWSKRSAPRVDRYHPVPLVATPLLFYSI